MRIDVGGKFPPRARVALIKLTVFVARSKMSSIYETLSSLTVVVTLASYISSLSGVIRP